jgi:hypothetical protein
VAVVERSDPTGRLGLTFWGLAPLDPIYEGGFVKPGGARIVKQISAHSSRRRHRSIWSGSAGHHGRGIVAICHTFLEPEVEGEILSTWLFFELGPTWTGTLNHLFGIARFRERHHEKGFQRTPPFSHSWVDAKHRRDRGRVGVVLQVVTSTTA